MSIPPTGNKKPRTPGGMKGQIEISERFNDPIFYDAKEVEALILRAYDRLLASKLYDKYNSGLTPVDRYAPAASLVNYCRDELGL